VATTLKAHPVWHNVAEVFAAIDPIAIAHQHIQACKAEIHGYWDEEDKFYETIGFSQPIEPELVSSSLGITPDHNGDSPWLNLRYSLKLKDSEVSVGELSLILSDTLEVIDENWLIDTYSPQVVRTPGIDEFRA
jgi:hypothetical protein